MSRTIKFRAWDGKRMTTSGIMFNTSTGELVVPTEASFNGLMTTKYELMQFTGLLDKNLKEIYEGDILKVQWEKDSIGGYMQSSDGYVEKEEIVIVEWMNIGWGFKKKDGKFTSLPKNCTIEVIGNIYETPNKGGDDE